MSENIIIRKAEAKDFEAVQSVQLTGDTDVLTFGNVIAIADMRMLSSNPNGIFGVAETDGCIIGFIYGEKLAGCWAMASYFVVHPDYRGGVAHKKLGGWFIEQAKILGAKYVLLYAVAQNKKLINFYKRFGFTDGDEYVEMIKEI